MATLAELEKEARLRERINESLNGYADNLKKISKLQRTTDDLTKRVAEQQAKFARTGSAADLQTLQNLQTMLDNNKQSLALYKKIGKEATSIKVTSEFIRGTWTDTKKVLGGVSNIYGIIVSQTKFITEIDKKIKMSALSMGILKTQTDSFRKSLANAGTVTNDFGINQGQLAEMQAAYSQELGRTVMLGTEGLIAIGEMAAATGLAAEGAAKMSADFELIGYSAEKTSDFIEQTMNDSSKMGLNASKVVKAISNNMKLLNKYNFKGGVAGLKKMAETTTKLGVDMNFVTGMADKLFDIEGAVQMSAELQVLGGSFARLADPFHLMFMARNDVAGLTEEIGKATEEFVSFNAATGNFDISAMGMHQLRKIAEQTGLEFESLVTAGKNASKFTMIKSQVSFNMDDEDREFLANTAKLDEKGRAYIEVNGERKYLNMLGAQGEDFIKQQIAEKKSLADRAKASLTFDETITNFINKVKELFLPLMPILDDFANVLVTSLEPTFKDIKATIGSKEFQDNIKDFATGAVEVAKTVGGLITWFIKNPGMGLAAIGLLEAAKWYLMGKSFGFGFKSVTGKGDGMFGMSKGLKGVSTGAKMMSKGRVASGAGTLVKGAGKFAAPLAIAGLGIDAYQNFSNEKLSGSDAAKKTLDQNKFMATGAAIGGGFGLFGGPFAPLTVPAGMAIGAGIGGIADFANSFRENDGLVGNYVDDGIIKFNPKDKFMKVDDSTMIAGTNVNGNMSLAKEISGNNTPKEIKHTFGDIKITGDIQITTPGGKEIPNELIKDPYFIKNITRLINIELEKVKNGNVLSPS